MCICDFHLQVSFGSYQYLKQNEAQSTYAKSTNMGDNKYSKDSHKHSNKDLSVFNSHLHVGKYKVHKLHQRYISTYSTGEVYVPS